MLVLEFTWEATSINYVMEKENQFLEIIPLHAIQLFDSEHWWFFFCDSVRFFQRYRISEYVL